MCLSTSMTSTARLSYTSGLPNENPKDHVEPHGTDEGTDQRLVHRCAERDQAALQELVQRYQPRLSRFLSRLLESREDTEEAVLDVFLRVWQQAPRFEGRASFATWLYRIASNVACDQLRQRTRQHRTTPLEDDTVGTGGLPESVSIEEAALNRLEGEERSKQVQRALQSLRVEDRLLLVLYYSEELGYEEIGQITKHSYPVLKMRLMRARRRLRTVMDGQATEDVG